MAKDVDRPMTDDEILEAFRERMAIVEVDGKRDPVNAAKVAGSCMRKQFGRVPDCVLKLIREIEKTHDQNQNDQT